MRFGHKDVFALSYCEDAERAKESDEDEHVGVCLRAVPERSYRGETFGCLGEVTEQRKLCGVIEVLEVPERVFTACISVYTQFIMKWSFL